MNQRSLLFGSLLCFASCAADAPAPAPTEPISLEGWRSETLSLPPGFAPSLPSGSESVLFAPGFFDSTTESHWSYAFTMWIDEPVPDAEQLDAMLEAYFDGLLGLVSRGAGRDVGSDSADVTVLSADAEKFEAKIRLIDVFDSYESVDLRVRGTAESGDETILRFLMSPQPYEHSVWASLAAASASLQKPE